MFISRVFLLYILLLIGCSAAFGQATPIILPGECTTGEIPVKNADGTWGCTTQAGGGGLPSGTFDDQMLKWNGMAWEPSTDGVGVLSNSYILPTADTHLAPKKYVDDSILSAGTSSITSIADADFTANNYEIVEGDLGAGFGNLLRVSLETTTQSSITIPNCAAGIEGLGIAINYASGTAFLRIQDVSLNEIKNLLHDNDTLTLVCDSSVPEWVVRQSTITNTGGVDVDSFTNNVTDILVLEDWLRHSGSATELNGGAITINGDGSIDIASSEWLIRDADASDATLRPIKIPALAGVTLTDDDTSYLIVDYNAGTPQYDVVSDITAINCTNQCTKAVLFRNGTQVDVISLAQYGVDFKAEYTKKQAVTDWLEYGLGLQPSFTGLEFSISGGVLYNGVSRYTIQSLSSAVDTFEYWYRDGAGGWTVTTGNTEINNTQYDDGTGALATFSTPQRGGVHWIYVSVDDPSRLLVVFGQEEYDDIASARAAQVPSVLPPFAEQFSTGKLVGKAIVQRNGTSLIDLESPFSTVFTGSTPVQHNNLSGLQGGTVDEYYHLTSVQHTSLTEVDTANIAYEDEANTFSESQRFNAEAVVNNNLNIYGNYSIKTWDNIGSTQYSYIRGDSDSLNFSAVDVPMTFKVGGVGGTEAMRIDTGGKLGIGTTTPTATLDVQVGSSVRDNIRFVTDDATAVGASATSNILQIQNNSINDSVLWFRDGSSNSNDWALWMDASEDKLKVNYETDNVLAITGDGNVGVSTASPEYQFHVDAGTDVAAAKFASDNSDAAIIRLENEDSSQEWSWGVAGTSNTHSDSGAMYFYDETDGSVKMIIKTDDDAWFAGDVSVLSLTDRTPYPESLEIAVDAVKSMKRLPDGEYDPDNKEQQLDHSKLHPYLKSDSDEDSRDLSATVSAQNEVIKHLLRVVSAICEAHHEINECQ